MQSRTVPGLQLFISMPKMPQNKQRVQSASAQKEAKLRVWNLTLFHSPISHQIFVIAEDLCTADKLARQLVGSA